MVAMGKVDAIGTRGNDVAIEAEGNFGKQIARDGVRFTSGIEEESQNIMATGLVMDTGGFGRVGLQQFASEIDGIRHEF